MASYLLQIAVSTINIRDVVNIIRECAESKYRAILFHVLATEYLFIKINLGSADS